MNGDAAETEVKPDIIEFFVPDSDSLAQQHEKVLHLVSSDPRRVC